MRSSLLGPLCFPLLLVAAAACGGSGAAAPGASTASTAASTGSKPADHPESDKVTWKKDSPAKNCHIKASGDLVAGATSVATGCVDTRKMRQLGQPTTGQRAAATDPMVQTIPLKAQANHCYRIFGLAEPTVTDFDIAVMDSAGKSAGEDLTDSNDAIVLEDGAICFNQDDNVSVNAAVASGTGKWAVEIWSD
jgi:hypothetical protein